MNIWQRGLHNAKARPQSSQEAIKSIMLWPKRHTGTKAQKHLRRKRRVRRAPRLTRSTVEQLYQDISKGRSPVQQLSYMSNAARSAYVDSESPNESLQEYLPLDTINYATKLLEQKKAALQAMNAKCKAEVQDFRKILANLNSMYQGILTKKALLTSASIPSISQEKTEEATSIRGIQPAGSGDTWSLLKSAAWSTENQGFDKVREQRLHKLSDRGRCRADGARVRLLAQNARLEITTSQASGPDLSLSGQGIVSRESTSPCTSISQRKSAAASSNNANRDRRLVNETVVVSEEPLIGKGKVGSLFKTQQHVVKAKAFRLLRMKLILDVRRRIFAQKLGGKRFDTVASLLAYWNKAMLGYEKRDVQLSPELFKPLQEQLKFAQETMVACRMPLSRTIKRMKRLEAVLSVKAREYSNGHSYPDNNAPLGVFVRDPRRKQVSDRLGESFFNAAQDLMWKEEEREDSIRSNLECWKDRVDLIFERDYLSLPEKRIARNYMKEVLGRLKGFEGPIREVKQKTMDALKFLDAEVGAGHQASAEYAALNFPKEDYTVREAREKDIPTDHQALIRYISTQSRDETREEALSQDSEAAFQDMKEAEQYETTVFGNPAAADDEYQRFEKALDIIEKEAEADDMDIQTLASDFKKKDMPENASLEDDATSIATRLLEESLQPSDSINIYNLTTTTEEKTEPAVEMNKNIATCHLAKVDAWTGFSPSRKMEQTRLREMVEHPRARQGEGAESLDKNFASPVQTRFDLGEKSTEDQEQRPKDEAEQNTNSSQETTDPSEKALKVIDMIKAVDPDVFSHLSEHGQIGTEEAPLEPNNSKGCLSQRHVPQEAGNQTRSYATGVAAKAELEDKSQIGLLTEQADSSEQALRTDADPVPQHEAEKAPTTMVNKVEVAAGTEEQQTTSKEEELVGAEPAEAQLGPILSEASFFKQAWGGHHRAPTRRQSTLQPPIAELPGEEGVASTEPSILEAEVTEPEPELELATVEKTEEKGPIPAQTESFSKAWALQTLGKEAIPTAKPAFVKRQPRTPTKKRVGVVLEAKGDGPLPGAAAHFTNAWSGYGKGKG